MGTAGVTAITGKRFSWNGNVLVSSGGAWTVALARPPGGFSLVWFETPSPRQRPQAGDELLDRIQPLVGAAVT
jgi:hypothetical protein